MSKKQELRKIAQEIREIKSALSRISYDHDRKFMKEIEKATGMVFLNSADDYNGMILNFLPYKGYDTRDQSGIVSIEQHFPEGVFADEEEFFVFEGKTYKSRRDLVRALKRL